MTKGSGLQPGTPRQLLEGLLRVAATADGDRAGLARGGRGGASGKSDGGQNNGEKGNFAGDHGDLEGIKL